MMLLAAVSDVVWQALIGAVVTIVLAWMQLKTKAAVEKGNADAAVKAEEVKVDLQTANVLQADKLEQVAAKVESVHHATNSLTDRLIEKTEKEALARGGMEERERAEAQAEKKLA